MRVHLRTHVTGFERKFNAGFSLAFYQPILYELIVENMDILAHLFSTHLSQGFLCLLFMCVNKGNVLACLKPVILLCSWQLVMCLWKDYRLNHTSDQTKRNTQTQSLGMTSYVWHDLLQHTKTRVRIWSFFSVRDKSHTTVSWCVNMNSDLSILRMI